MRVLIQIFMAVLCAVLSSAPVMAMTVAEAYQAIPHQRTPFDRDDARMRAEEKKYLADLFPLLDVAVVGRIEALRWFQTGGSEGSSYDAYHARMTQLLGQLSATPAPERLRKFRKLLETALRNQDAFYGDWAKTSIASPHKSVNTQHPLVVRAHRSLLEAYMTLARLYPHEGAHNQSAFYDTLRALDFI